MKRLYGYLNQIVRLRTTTKQLKHKNQHINTKQKANLKQNSAKVASCYLSVDEWYIEKRNGSFE